MQVFSQAQAALARYWYERTIYTHGPAALAAGPSPIFTASAWTNPQNPEWMAALIGLSVTQHPGVQLQWIYDKKTANQSAAQGYTSAAPAGLRRMPVMAPAVEQLTLIANNLTGAPIAGWQCNYEIAMQRLTVADKILYGYKLSAADEQILKKLGKDGKREVTDLVARGTSPIPISSQLERTVENRSLGDHSASGLYHVSGGMCLAFATAMSTSDEFLVLREIAVEGGGALAQQLTVMVDRDEDLSYLQLNAQAFAQTDDQPWRVFVPAMRSLTFRVAGSPLLTNVPIRIKVERFRISNLLKVRFGLATTPESVPGDTYAKVWAGIS